jgi:hypothetical protein
MKKLTAYIKAHRLFILLTAGAIFLLIIAFRGCNNLPSHKDEKKEMDSLSAAYEGQIGALKRDNVNLSFQKDSIQRKFDSASLELAANRKDGAAKIEAVKQTLTSGDRAAARRDTAAMLINWDSLRAQVVAGLPVVVANDSLSQQVIAACVAQGAVKDSLIANYATMWQKADNAYSRQRAAYNGLYTDYSKANSRLKFNKTLSRGLAIALLVAGAKIFIFK